MRLSNLIRDMNPFYNCHTSNLEPYNCPLGSCIPHDFVPWSLYVNPRYFANISNASIAIPEYFRVKNVETMYIKSKQDTATR